MSSDLEVDVRCSRPASPHVLKSTWPRAAQSVSHHVMPRGGSSRVRGFQRERDQGGGRRWLQVARSATKGNGEAGGRKGGNASVTVHFETDRTRLHGTVPEAIYHTPHRRHRLLWHVRREDALRGHNTDTCATIGMCVCVCVFIMDMSICGWFAAARLGFACHHVGFCMPPCSNTRANKTQVWRVACGVWRVACAWGAMAS